MPKDKDNPWNELNPYNEGQLIYGRNQITTKIVDAIYSNLQTVLYGKTGIGKTSLLQAGCFPELRKLHFFPIVIRLGIIEGSSDYVDTVISIIRKAAGECIPGKKPPFHIKTVGNGLFTDNRLCQFLYSTQFVDDEDTPYIPVLIFDQFEEFLNNKKIFTAAVDFVKELYILLDNTISIPTGYLEYSNYRLVFAIREDYLYCLEDIIDHYNLDELRYNRYRITALTDKQAQSVIEKTFRNSIEDISSDDLKTISNIIIPTAKGQNDYADIRTPILSLLGSLIYKQLVAGYNLDSIDTRSTNIELYLYYDDIMSEPKIPLEVRWFLEQKLITVDGRRDSMDYQSALLTNQINEEQIDYLVNEKKILRVVDAGSGERRLEFSHDTICRALKPVIEIRDSFYQKGNDLFYSGSSNEKMIAETVRYFSYAVDLGHYEAKIKLFNLYEENANGVDQDQRYKASNSKKSRLIHLLNGDELSITSKRKDDSRYDVFLCYSRRDIAVATSLQRQLQSFGCRVWFDINESLTGEDFANVMKEAINNTRILLFIGSANSYLSSWTYKELMYAIEKGKIIYPVFIDHTPIPVQIEFLLCNLNWYDYWNKEQKKELFHDLQNRISDNYSIDENSGVESLKIIINDYTIEMVRVEGGLFTMGATLQQGGENPDERIVHDVRLDSYYIAKVPVTQELWEKVMGRKTNSRFRNKLLGKIDDSYMNRPVESVSWKDCITFIKCLNALTGREFRLPTEAEWEYAAKGGVKGRFNGYKYSGGNNLNNVAWISENSGGRTHEVAKKQPNELGIYDMSGNVWEWCSDWYAPYPDYLVTNPRGPKDGNKKVCRGGSWNDKGKDCRISRREARDPLTKNAYIGFRLVL